MAGALYTRYGLNPTTFALEETLAGIEGAEASAEEPTPVPGG